MASRVWRVLGAGSIRQKLAGLGMLSSFAALSAACLAFLLYDGYTVRDALAQRILSEARIVAFNSVSPLLFDDAETAAATLAGLRVETAVAAAEIRKPGETQPFARYARGSGAGSVEGAPDDRGQRFTSDALLLGEPLLF